MSLPILRKKEYKIMSRLVATTVYRRPIRRIVDITIIREYRDAIDWEGIVFFCVATGLFGLMSLATMILESRR